jgi:hypothetical protein
MPSWGNIIARNSDFTLSTSYTRVAVGSSSGSTANLGSGDGQVTIYNVAQYYYNEIIMNATSSTLSITSMNGKSYSGTISAIMKDMIQNGSDINVTMIGIN